MAAPASAVDFSANFTTVNLADILVNKPDRLGNVFESPFIREMLNDGEQPVSPEENIVDLPVTPENFSRFQDRSEISELMTPEEIENFVEFLDWLGIDVPRYIYTYMNCSGNLKISKELCERCAIDECTTRFMGCLDLPKIGRYDEFQDRLERIFEQNRVQHIANPSRSYVERDREFAKQLQIGYDERISFNIIEELFVRAIRSGNMEYVKALEKAVPEYEIRYLKNPYSYTHVNYHVQLLEIAAFEEQFDMFEYLRDNGYGYYDDYF